MPKTELTFEQWLAEVDRILEALVGTDSRCAYLANHPYAHWYAAVVTPREAAREAVKDTKGG